MIIGEMWFKIIIVLNHLPVNDRSLTLTNVRKYSDKMIPKYDNYIQKYNYYRKYPEIYKYTGSNLNDLIASLTCEFYK